MREDIGPRPGCMSRNQVKGLLRAMKGALRDPSLLCDLEGCGPVAMLESGFSGICGTRYAVAVSSGTAAIHTALLACGLGPGDEVIVTSYSWPQSVSPVIHVGATPVFADIDPITLNIDPRSVEARISKRTKAILPVQLFGHAADMRRLEQIAEDCGALLISDAAQGLGIQLEGRPIGSWGDVSCFSLGRGKLVSSGEGGILVTDNQEIFERAVALSQHPERTTRIRGNERLGEPFALNYRMHPLAALLGYSDLKQMKTKLEKRMAVLEAYLDGIADQEILIPPRGINQEKCAAYGIPLIFAADTGREELVRMGRERGVPLRCGPVTVPLHLRTGRRDEARGTCPDAEEQCERKEIFALSTLDMDWMSIPEAHHLGKRTCDAVEEWRRSGGTYRKPENDRAAQLTGLHEDAGTTKP